MALSQQRRLVRFIRRIAVQPVKAGQRTFRRLTSRTFASLFGVDRGLRLLPRDLYSAAVWMPTTAIECDIAAKIYYQMPKRLVQDGEWDIVHCRVIATNPTVQQLGVEEIVVKKIPFEETARFRRLRQRIESGDHCRGITAVEDLEERYGRQLLELYDNIRLEGIKTAEELRSAGVSDASNILVLIDRHGAPLLLGGKHRFAIIGLLGIPYVPVQVVGVHRIWAQKSVEQYGGGAWNAVIEGIKALGTTTRPAAAMHASSYSDQAL
jgi:hypothetical protein